MFIIRMINDFNSKIINSQKNKIKVWAVPNTYAGWICNVIDTIILMHCESYTKGCQFI